MLATFYGYTISPREFNLQMREKGLYSGKYRNLYSLDALHKLFPEIEYIGFRDTSSDNIIRGEIDAGRPVLVKILLHNGNKHYALAIDHTPTDIIIADPYDGRIRALKSRYKQLLRYVLYKGKVKSMGRFVPGTVVSTKGKAHPNVDTAVVKSSTEDGLQITVTGKWADGNDFEFTLPTAGVENVLPDMSKYVSRDISQQAVSGVQQANEKLKSDYNQEIQSLKAANGSLLKTIQDNKVKEAERNSALDELFAAVEAFVIKFNSKFNG